MRGSRQRYQHGSVRKVSRSRGFPWEFRFYITALVGIVNYAFRRLIR
jgi:hypothetical protein